MNMALQEKKVEWEALYRAGVNGTHELEAVTAALTTLRMEHQVGSTGSADMLVALHGALLLFQVAGEADMVPVVGFAPFGERALQRRIAAAALRLAGKDRGPQASFAAWCRAGDTVNQYIGLIDPELCKMVA